MSDGQLSRGVIDLGEIFESRDFGRRPAHPHVCHVGTFEPAGDPPLLEQIFLSDLFGQPEAVVAPATPRTVRTAASLARPTLVLLPGRGDTERDASRYRGAIGAVSGVAAAALVVAGMTSGSSQLSGQPTISAAGRQPGQGSQPSSGGSSPGTGGGVTPSSTPGTATSQPPATSGGAGVAPPAAQVMSTTTPAPAAAVVGVSSPTPVEVAVSPPPPGGGTTPSATSPAGGGGSVLTPVKVALGGTVSAAGSTVTAASTELKYSLPISSPVTGLLGNVGSAVTNLGRSVGGA